MQGEVAAVNILESVSGQQTGESDAVNINYNWSLAKLHVYAVSERLRSRFVVHSSAVVCNTIHRSLTEKKGGNLPKRKSVLDTVLICFNTFLYCTEPSLIILYL